MLRLLTGSDDFLLADGTVGLSVSFAACEPRFEPGVTPQQTTTPEWLTFSEAADEAGISRLYGGIHFNKGDRFGRDLGRLVGASVHDRVQYYLTGAIPEPDAFSLTLAALTTLAVRPRV